MLRTKRILSVASILVCLTLGIISGLAVVNYSNSSFSDSSVYDSELVKTEISDMISSYDMISTVEYVGTGDIIEMGNGIIQFPGTAAIDDTAYYIENIFTVKNVLKDETDGVLEANTAQIVGSSTSKIAETTITVLEYIGYGDLASVDNAIDKSGEYLLFTVAGEGNLYALHPEVALQQIVDDEILWSDEITGINNFDSVSDVANTVYETGELSAKYEAEITDDALMS